MITLDVSEMEEPVTSTGFFVLKLDRRYPPELWEFVHESIASKLGSMNLHGSVEHSNTGQSQLIRKL
jgi:hypothetical protein